MEFKANLSGMKNIEKEKVLKLTEAVEYKDGQIVSKTLSQNKNVNLTLFAFDKDEEISTHTSKGDAFVQVLDGVALVTINEKSYELKSGESIVMPSNIPHAVYAKEKMKFLLTVIF
ncbi:MAG: cupin domain-containing protein [Campylobacteraceae bacterium]